jgi:hypothetical protein
MGIDCRMNHKVGIRIQGAHVFTRHLHDQDIPVQHNFCVAAGCVFSIGA